MNVPGFIRSSFSLCKVIALYGTNSLLIELPYTAPPDLNNPKPYKPRMKVEVDRLFAKTMQLPCDETAEFAVGDTAWLRSQEGLVGIQPNVIPGGIPSLEYGMIYHIIGKYTGANPLP